MSLQFRGDIFFQLQISSLWASMSMFDLHPTNAVTSFITHRSEWNDVLPLLTFSLQWLQVISICGKLLTWSLAMSRVKVALLPRHSPWNVDSTLDAKIFLQNWCTLCRHIAQEISLTVFPSSSTQKPQNEWTHGVAICVNTTGFVLRKKKKKQQRPNWTFFVSVFSTEAGLSRPAG